MSSSMLLNMPYLFTLQGQCNGAMMSYNLFYRHVRCPGQFHFVLSEMRQWFCCFVSVWQWRSFQTSIVYDQHLSKVGVVQTGKGLMVYDESLYVGSELVEASVY